MADRIITIRHHQGCGAVAYFNISREAGGSHHDMGHVTVGAPPNVGDPIPCAGCGAPMAKTVGGDGTVEYVEFSPYADRVE